MGIRACLDIVVCALQEHFGAYLQTYAQLSTVGIVQAMELVQGESKLSILQ
jgi:hypothetical protein